jgi:hypothetical protein
VIQPATQANELYNPNEQDEGRYWRTGETIRVSRTVQPGLTHETLVRDGRIWTLSTYEGNSSKRYLGVGKFQILDRGDVWDDCLFTHWGGAKTWGTFLFADMLDMGARIGSAEQVTEGGRSLVHVKLIGLEAVREFWFDPQVNYLVRKSTYIPDTDKSLVRETEVIRFSEATPGIFFPTEIEQRGRNKDRPFAVVRTTISDLTVNRSLSKSDMRLPNIAGLITYDSDRQTDYKVDADGNRAGPETPTKVKRGLTTSASETASRPIPPSKPPWPLWLWILIVSICCLLVAAGLRYRRRRDSETQSPPHTAGGVTS